MLDFGHFSKVWGPIERFMAYTVQKLKEFGQGPAKIGHRFILSKFTAVGQALPIGVASISIMPRPGMDLKTV